MVWRGVFQVLAVVSALTLAGGFVFVKAGGVIPGLPFNVPDEPKVFSSSKVKALAPAMAIPEVLSGSKSFSGTTTIEGGTTDPLAEPGLLPSQPSEQDLLPGSKAPISPIIPEAVKPSAQVLPGFKSAVITPLGSIMAKQRVVLTTEEIEVFFSTKSGAVFPPPLPGNQPEVAPPPQASESDEP